MQNQNNSKTNSGFNTIAVKLPENIREYIILGIGIISMLITSSLFFTPFYSYKSIADLSPNPTIHTFSPINVFLPSQGDVDNIIIFSALLLLFSIGFAFLLKSIIHLVSGKQIIDCVWPVCITCTLTTAAYFLSSIGYCSFLNIYSEEFRFNVNNNYVPFILMLVVLLVLSLLSKGLLPQEQTFNKPFSIAKIELLFYGLVISAITIISSLSDILEVNFTEPAKTSIYLNGYDILFSAEPVSSGFQLVAFLLFAILTIIICFAIASLTAFISRSKLFYKITLFEIIFGSVFCLIIGLCGKYYEMVQAMNQDMMLEWIKLFLPSNTLKFVFTVKSTAYYFFLAAMAVVLAVIIRKPYSKAALDDIPVRSHHRSPAISRTSVSNSTSASLPEASIANPCPAFAELDFKADFFEQRLSNAKALSFASPSLSNIVNFVVNYARDSRLHLSYTPEDIATFIAGLGATRLTILQGMSGTGKTSLPKIFAEAIFGNCDIIEVESSWRDKNELLGYYNEFSRTYTPKKFTQALYKAKLNPEFITFIVLDEMNLSRIEYYFSDFLSLMENEEDKRAIKLLNVGLFRTEEDELYPYSALTDGHTIEIPNNIWFIGTANRDESTFEISDKVYDRAHTMNFNKRAPKVVSFQQPISQQYISTNTFISLLDEAKQKVRFDINSNPLVKEVETLLAPYNISFGNRIANQIEAFVSIYCACFEPSQAVENEALERILLSKIVSKLEFKSIENKEQLALEFQKRNLKKCSEFILKLNED